MAELEEQGTHVRQDMGTITGLEELRKTMREANIEHAYANARSGQWHDRKANENYLLDHRGYDNSSCNQTCLREGEEPEEIMTQAEWDLMTFTVPEHPGAENEPIRSTDAAASSIGFLNQISPKAVREYLEGRSEEPNPPTGTPVPGQRSAPRGAGACRKPESFPSH